MSDETEASDRMLRHAVGEALGVYGHARDDLLLVDIAIIVTQRGFEGDDGISRTILLQPTDTPSFTLLGMLEEVRMEVREGVMSHMRAGREDSE